MSTQLQGFPSPFFRPNESYRFGFNGKENDPETGTQDYGMRIYDRRLGRFLSVDPLSKQFPELTPYQFASNTPIMAVDLDGLEAKPNFANDLEKQKVDEQAKTAIVNYIYTQINGSQIVASYAATPKLGVTESTVKDQIRRSITVGITEYKEVPINCPNQSAVSTPQCSTTVPAKTSVSLTNPPQTTAASPTGSGVVEGVAGFAFDQALSAGGESPTFKMYFKQASKGYNGLLAASGDPSGMVGLTTELMGTSLRAANVATWVFTPSTFGMGTLSAAGMLTPPLNPAQREVNARMNKFFGYSNPAPAAPATTEVIATPAPSTGPSTTFAPVPQDRLQPPAPRPQ